MKRCKILPFVALTLLGGPLSAEQPRVITNAAELAVAAGASGAIMKDASMDEQLAAIRDVAAGGTVFSPEIRRSIEESPAPPEFTHRQLQILQSVSRGLGNKEIAAILGISTDAVKQHINAICSKLGAVNRAEAVAIALRKRMLKT